MNVPGSFFKRPLKENLVIIKGDTLQCHSYDGDGFGIIKKWSKPESIDRTDDLQFTLSEKDFQLMSMFDEIDLSMKKDTIQCRSGKSKFNVQNITEAKAFKPNMEGMVGLDIPLDTIRKAALFVGKEDKCRGVIITPKGVYGTDSSVVYFNKCATVLSERIMIPTESMKLLDRNTSYKLATNKKALMYSGNGEAVYSPLYENAVNVDNLKFNKLLKVKLDKSALLEELSKAEAFNGLVELTISEDVLTISTPTTEGNSRSYESQISIKSEIKAMRQMFIINNLVKLLKIIDSNEISFGNGNCFIGGDQEYALALCYSSQDRMPPVAKEEK